jgi:pimeloyl-ACP methyl ester carboxylesterase
MKSTAFGTLFLVIALAACDRAPPPQAEPETPPASEPGASATIAELEPGEHTWTTADGNRVPYTVTGDGGTTVLLVHCWMCSREFWSNQVPVLAESYRTIALDLPGHGDASANRETWTVAAFGEDVGGLIEALDLRDVVLVGHSMGGPVSLRAAALAGDRVRGIVAVDTLHDAEFDYAAAEKEYMAAFDADFVGTCSGMVQQMFPEEGVQPVIDQVRTTACREEAAPVGTALMHDFANIDMPRWFSEAGVPIRAINAAAPNPTRIESNRKYADFDAVLMQNVGHFPHMTRPDEFNPLLLHAIAEIVDPQSL